MMNDYGYSMLEQQLKMRPTIQPQYIDPADIVQIDGRLYLRGIDGRLTPLDSWLVVEAFRHWKETAERLENPPEKL